MKFSAQPLARLACLASVAALYACGGGGGGSSTSVASVSTGSATGILTDAAIQGVSYTTSSGVSGVTDASGGYKYNPGDTVTFKLGSVTLGNATANGIISPIDLAAGDANKYRNLLVLVQSLDADGNPGNGIAVSAAAAAALPAGLDLTQALETSFAASIATAASTAGSGGVVTGANANAHFLSQALPLLSSNVYTFVPADHAAGHFGLLRVSASGEYLEGEVGTPSTAIGFRPGVEHGVAVVDIADAHGFHLSSIRDIDTNDSAGVNNLGSACQRLVPMGSGLYAPNTNQTMEPCNFLPGNPVTLKKAENDPAGIVGVWAHGSANTVLTETFVFTSSGNFLTVDPVHPGVESGTYGFNNATKTLTLPIPLAYDTNGAAGLSDGSSNSTSKSFVLSADGQTIAVNGGAGGGGSTLYRISK